MHPPPIHAFGTNTNRSAHSTVHFEGDTRKRKHLATIKAPHGLPTPPATGDTSNGSTSGRGGRRRGRRAGSPGASSNDSSSLAGGAYEEEEESRKRQRLQLIGQRDASSFYGRGPSASFSSQASSGDAVRKGEMVNRPIDSPANPFINDSITSSSATSSKKVSSNPARYTNLHAGLSHPDPFAKSQASILASRFASTTLHDPTSSSSGVQGRASMPPPSVLPDGRAAAPTGAMAGPLEVESASATSSASSQAAVEAATQQSSPRPTAKDRHYIRRGEMMYVFRGMRVTFMDPDSEPEDEEEYWAQQQQQQKQQYDASNNKHAIRPPPTADQEYHSFPPPDANPRYKPRKLFAEEIAKREAEAASVAAESQSQSQSALDRQAPCTPPRASTAADSLQSHGGDTQRLPTTPPLRVRGAHRKNIRMITDLANPSSSDREVQEDSHDGDASSTLTAANGNQIRIIKKRPQSDLELASDAQPSSSAGLAFIEQQERAKRQRLMDSCFSGSDANQPEREDEEEDVFGPKIPTMPLGTARPITHGVEAPRHSTSLSAHVSKPHCAPRPSMLDMEGMVGQASQEDIRHQERLNDIASAAARELEAKRNGA